MDCLSRMLCCCKQTHPQDHQTTQVVTPGGRTCESVEPIGGRFERDYIESSQSSPVSDISVDNTPRGMFQTVDTFLRETLEIHQDTGKILASRNCVRQYSNSDKTYFVKFFKDGNIVANPDEGELLLFSLPPSFAGKPTLFAAVLKDRNEVCHIIYTKEQANEIIEKNEGVNLAAIVEEKIEGRCVEDSFLLKEIPPEMGNAIASQLEVICDQLAHEDIVHRDIKGLNLIVDKANVLHLIDWESAKKGKRNSICGTVSYMHLDMFQDKKYGCYVDKWAVAVTLLELAAEECLDHIFFDSKALDQLKKKGGSDIFYSALMANALFSMIPVIDKCRLLLKLSDGKYTEQSQLYTVYKKFISISENKPKHKWIRNEDSLLIKPAVLEACPSLKGFKGIFAFPYGF